MKTIINDRHMVFNVDPLKKTIVDGSLQYILGYPDDYSIEDYFYREKLQSYLLNLLGIVVLILTICLFQYNYLLKHGTKTITNKSQSIKINCMHGTYLFNRIYTIILFIIYLYFYTKEFTVYEWNYDCIPSEVGNSIESSTYYYSIFNEAHAEPYDLTNNFFEYHPDMKEEDCGPRDVDCCRIDVLCHGYKKAHHTYSLFNSTLQLRLNEPRTGSMIFPISSLRHDCTQYDIVHLISYYIYNDRQIFLLHLIGIFFCWFISNIIICLLIFIFKPKWIPLNTNDLPIRGSV